MLIFVPDDRQTHLKISIMKITKQKVIARLVKWGHNEANATSWTNEHFDYAIQHYKTVSKVADVISIIY